MQLGISVFMNPKIHREASSVEPVLGGVSVPFSEVIFELFIQLYCSRTNLSRSFTGACILAEDPSVRYRHLAED